MKLLILAAGKGKRLNSDVTHIPKVMREANGHPLLHYVLASTDFINQEDVTIIVGFEKEKIMNAYPQYSYAIQTEQKGTGHAVSCAEDNFAGYDGDIMVVNGDMPLVKRSTLEKLAAHHKESGNDCTILTCIQEEGEIMHYGRILRDENGMFQGVVEQKDATEEQRQIRELNVGMYVFNSKKLFESLKKVSASRATGEYYITDVPLIMRDLGYKSEAFPCGEIDEFFGVNDENDLKTVEIKLGAR